MTELIVALDALEPLRTFSDLYKIGLRWFKLGPQAMTSMDWSYVLRSWMRLTSPPSDCKIFVDAKLADTADTVRETVKSLADLGVTSVSTFTVNATAAAILADTSIRVWQVVELTDESRSELPPILGHAVICGGARARQLRLTLNRGTGIVVPGVRLDVADDFHGHAARSTVSDIAGLADFAVVGRPIWAAVDQAAAAKKYQLALKSS